MVFLFILVGCVGNIVADSGYIISPGFLAGLDYPNFQQCTWTVTSASSGEALNMAFRDPFDLENNVDMLTVSTIFICMCFVTLLESNSRL